MGQKEILAEIENYLEPTDNKKTTYKYLCDTAKEILKRHKGIKQNDIKEMINSIKCWFFKKISKLD